MPNDEDYMRMALQEAQRAYDADEVPVGAIVVQEGRILGRGYNQVELLKDPTRLRTNPKYGTPIAKTVITHTRRDRAM